MKADLSRVFQGNQMYRAIWRWHFYMGLLAMPFLFMLCLSGLLMLGSKPLDSYLDRGLTSVPPQGQALPASALLASVRAQYPDADVQLYIPAAEPDESARFALTRDAHGQAGHNQPTITVYLDPYNGAILGSRDPSRTLYERVKVFHSTLLLGSFGNIAVEGAAGLTILMVLSGLLLSWSQWSRHRSVAGTRGRWRQWHKLSGWIAAIPLLFFLVSGLAWTEVWGGKLVQPWGSLPSTSFAAPPAERTHDSLNLDGIQQVPWALEQTPLPHALSGARQLELDDVVLIAKQQGFERYRVHLPQHEGGVWTLSATTMAGDTRKPFTERILHLDPADGRPLANITFSEYPLMGKAMAASIPLHQGDLGLWNLLLNAAIISFILFLMSSAILLWWKRRAPHMRGLQAPLAAPVTNKTVIGITLLIALCFPVSAAILALVAAIDLLLVYRARALQGR